MKANAGPPARATDMARVSSRGRVRRKRGWTTPWAAADAMGAEERQARHRDPRRREGGGTEGAPRPAANLLNIH
jgi:hypothetical protein